MPTIGTATMRMLTSSSRARIPTRNEARRDRSRSAGIGGLVAEAVHGLDRIDAERAQLGADAADVGVDGALGDVVVVAARPIDELRAGQHATGPLQQRAQHV